MNIGLIFAGGSGRRMNTKALPKQFLKMNGKEIIIHTIEHFEACDAIDAIVVVCIKEYTHFLENLVDKYSIKKVKKIVAGGENGQQSIQHGLQAVHELAVSAEDIVLIHDGVRPLITEQLILDNIDTVKEFGNAITITPVNETIIEVDENRDVACVLNRELCCAAKAPQSFYVKDIYEAHEHAIRDGREDFIDSATLMQHYGHHLHTVVGPVENIKITNPSDFYIFRAILEAKENSQIFGL